MNLLKRLVLHGYINYGRYGRGVRIVVAPDKFAGTLSARQAAEAIKSGWLAYAPNDELQLVPMSDGGPGFIDVLATATGGRLVEVKTHGPLGEPVTANFLLHADTAYVESAQVCGLHLINTPNARTSREATSAGLADVLVAALNEGVARIVVGVGGTACTDGGEPMVERFKQLTGRTRVDAELLVATDVDNPLLGQHGAANVFGPQKGAQDGDVDFLEQQLTSWAQRTAGDADAPGSGAGGGLGFGLFLLSGTRVSGIDTCMDAVELDAAIASADLVITGEGSFDYQSLRGKVVSGVAGRASAKARPCLVLAGQSSVGRQGASASGIDQCWSVVDFVGSVEKALSEPFDALAGLARSVAAVWSSP